MGILGDARRLRRNARRLSMGRTAFRIGLTGCIGPATMEIVLALPVRCVRRHGQVMVTSIPGPMKC